MRLIRRSRTSPESWRVEQAGPAALRDLSRSEVPRSFLRAESRPTRCWKNLTRYGSGVAGRWGGWTGAYSRTERELLLVDSQNLSMHRISSSIRTQPRELFP